MENQYFRKEFVVWSRPDFRISLLVSQEMTAWILWFHILNCSRVETAWEYQWMVFKISADEPSLPHPQTWSWGWLCCCERLPRQVWCTGVAPPLQGVICSWRKWGARIDEVLLFSFNLKNLGNHTLHIRFGLRLVYTKGTDSKDSCPRIPTGLVVQSCGFDVLVLNVSQGLSTRVPWWLSAVEMHRSSVSVREDCFLPFLLPTDKSSLPRSNEHKRTLNIYVMRTAVIKAKMPFNY